MRLVCSQRRCSQVITSFQSFQISYFCHPRLMWTTGFLSLSCAWRPLHALPNDCSRSQTATKSPECVTLLLAGNSKLNCVTQAKDKENQHFPGCHKKRSVTFNKGGQTQKYRSLKIHYTFSLLDLGHFPKTVGRFHSFSPLCSPFPSPISQLRDLNK